MRPRVGLFGGTFDPPHLGHIILAAEALEQLHLSRLLWVLTPDPPHKTDLPITPVEHRLEMVRRVLEAHPEFELSRLELDRSRSSSARASGTRTPSAMPLQSGFRFDFPVITSSASASSASPFRLLVRGRRTGSRVAHG